jgi:hypothetical protein
LTEDLAAGAPPPLADRPAAAGTWTLQLTAPVDDILLFFVVSAPNPR